MTRTPIIWHLPTDKGQLPLPGDRLNGRDLDGHIVIASDYLDDARGVLVMLAPEEPYYSLIELALETGDVTPLSQRFENIKDVIACYAEYAS